MHWFFAKNTTLFTVKLVIALSLKSWRLCVGRSDFGNVDNFEIIDGSSKLASRGCVPALNMTRVQLGGKFSKELLLPTHVSCEQQGWRTFRHSWAFSFSELLLCLFGILRVRSRRAITRQFGYIVTFCFRRFLRPNCDFPHFFRGSRDGLK